MTPNQPLQHAALDDFRSRLLSVTQGKDGSAISHVLDTSSPPCTGYKCRPMERGFLFMRLGTPAINKLIKPFADSFFPGLIQYVNKYADKELVQTAQSGTCCGWGDFGVKASAWLQGFYLNSIGEGQITLTTVPAVPPVPSQSVVVSLRASNVSAGFRNVGVSAGLAAGVPVNCKISCQASVTIPSLEISAQVQLLDDGVTFRITPVGAYLPNLSILLFPNFDNVCSILAAPIVAVFGLLATALTNVALPFLQGVIFDGVKSLICPNGACPEISIPAIPPIAINPAGQLNVYPDLQLLWADAPGLIIGNGLGHFQSTLSSPAWRAGRSHLTPLGTSAGIQTPLPTIDNMASISIGSVGASSFIENLWYLVWATLATDARGGESGLCTTTDTDPCPFPPIVTSVATGDLFTALSAIFLGHGPYSSFETSVLLPSPSVRFETGGSIGSIKGMQTANMPIRGLSGSKSDLLATVSAPYSLDAAVPKYDAATGIFSGLEISNLVFDSPAVTFPGQPPLEDLVKQLLALAAAGLTTVAGMLVPLLNNAITKALANTPLKIPAIEGVPLAGQLHIDLATATARGVSSPGENLQSYLKVDAAVTVTVSGQPDPPAAPLSSRKGEESEKSIRDTVIETAARWAKESNNPNASFSSFYSGPEAESETRTVYGRS